MSSLSVSRWYVANTNYYGGTLLLWMTLYPLWTLLTSLGNAVAMDKQWRRISLVLGIGCVILEILLIFEGRVLFGFDRQTRPNSMEMTLCRILVGIVDCIVGSMYAGFLYFYLCRINVTLEGTTHSVAKFVDRILLAAISAIVVVSFGSGLYRGFYSVEPFTPHKGFYCYIRESHEGWYLGLWRAFTALFLGCSLGVSIIFLRTLNRELRHQLDLGDRKVIFFLRKNTVLLFSSIVSSTTVMSLDAGIISWVTDCFLNYIFVFCSFKCGNRLFRVLFYPLLSWVEPGYNHRFSVLRRLSTLGASGAAYHRLTMEQAHTSRISLAGR